MAAVRVRVNVGRLPSIPGRIQLAKEETVVGVGTHVAQAIAVASRSKQISAATFALPAGPNSMTIEVGKGVPFALLRDRGGSAIPKRARMLRFADGGFRYYSRFPGIHYVAQGASQFGRITGQQFHEAFVRI